MGLFKSKAEKELDSIILRLEMNMSNNYKDNAQANLRELEAALETFRSDGKLKGATLLRYDSILGDYKEKMKGYSHKDQKPYWT
jgi:hypothetical protein